MNNTTESFYEKLFQNSSGIQVIIDGNGGQIVNANKTACKFYGYSKEEIKKLKIYDISSINDLEKIKHILNETLESKNTKIYLTHKLANGSVKDVKVIFSKVWIDGKIYFNLTICDVLESKNIKDKRDNTEENLNDPEEILGKVEANYRRMLDHLPVAIILSLRIEQKMLYQNPRFIELFGHTFEEFSEISEWWSIAYPDPEYREWVSKEWNSRLTEAIKNQSAIEPMEANITAKDGSIKHVCIHGTVLGDMNFITFIDMTGRKKAEEAMRLMNAYNRSLIEASLDALITVDSQGIIIDVNSATERATGYSRGELIGTDSFGYFTSSEKVKNAHEKVFKEGTIEDYELELKHKDGYATTVICNASVHKGKCGRVKGVFISARDITQRKIREEELEREKSAAEEANVLKSQFLATMSHELRTPVNVYNKETSIIISVKDTGVGIPQDKIEQIFERFIQVENTMIRTNEGSGIGLSIVKSFVEMHGGTINVLSQVGVGSQFTIKLPVKILSEQCDENYTILKNNQNYGEVLDIEFSDIYK